MVRIIAAAGIGYLGGKYLSGYYSDTLGTSVMSRIGVQAGAAFLAYFALGKVL